MPVGPRGLNRLTLLRCRRGESALPLIGRLRRPGHLLGGGASVHVAGRISASAETSRPIARIRIPGIRLSKTVEAGAGRVLLRLASCRISAPIEIIRAMLGLNRCASSRIAGKEMLIVGAARNRAGADLPVRRMEAFPRRRNGMCAGHHAGLAE